MMDLLDHMLVNAKTIGQLTPAHLSSIGRSDDMEWYSNLMSLFILQTQSAVSVFYGKILANLEAKSKNDAGIPTPIPFPNLEPRSD